MQRQLEAPPPSQPQRSQADGKAVIEHPDQGLAPHLRIVNVGFLKPAANLKQAEKADAVIDAARRARLRQGDRE